MNPDVAARVDAICDSFESSWKSGLLPEIAAVVSSVDVELRALVARQLMLVDAEYRRKQFGVAPTVDDYAVMMGLNSQVLYAAADTLDVALCAQHTPVIRSRSLSDDLHLRSRPEDKSGCSPDHADCTGPQIGPQIPGYIVLSELGRGGMGVVYKARQIRAVRMVALKTIHTPHLASREQVQRFQAEAEAAARLSHQGIVPVYEVGEHNGLHFFSMGLVDGADLETKAREQVLSSREAAKICRDLADALEYAHRNGVVHRDVKPSNVLIGPDGRPRLTDFGLAKLTNQDSGLTGSGQIIGTATYMPPEQATGSGTDIGPTTDIYALGATLYRCITGRPPFQAATTMEVLRQVANDEPVSPRRLNLEIDVDIETICLKCLEKDPFRRFQTAGELSAELTRYLNREPIHSRPISPLSRAWRWCIRRPAMATSLAMFTLLVLLMSTGVPYVLWHKNQLQEAKLKTEHDARSIERSESARQLERVSRKQAEESAAANAARASTQEYYVSIMKVRELRMQPDSKAGWTWEALQLLENAAATVADGKDPVVLRSLIADTLVTPDMREIGRIEGVGNTAALAVSHDGKLLAAGDYGDNPSLIRIYQINKVTNTDDGNQAQFELVKECSVDTTRDGIQSSLRELGHQSERIDSEGMWAIDFSPDDKQIAVGTRNGNITVWQIDSDPPRILFDQRFPEKRTNRLAFSADGGQIFASYSDPVAFRIFNLEDQSDRLTLFDHHVDFGMTHDGRVLVSSEGKISRIVTASLNEPVEFEQGGTHNRVVTDRRRSVAIVGTVPSHLLDPITGEKTLLLEFSASELARPGELTFAADTTIAIASVQPQNLRLWDALSGEKSVEISYPGAEPPRICAGPERDRLYVYSTVNIFAYQLRCAQPLQAYAAPPTSLSNAVSPVAAIVPGAQILSSFALSNDEQHVAVVEAAPFHSQQTIPDGYRARLRRLNTSDGQETGRWTCLLLGSGENRNTLTDGDAVTFLGGDRKIAFTTPAVGNIVVVSESGFEFASGIGIDVEQRPPIVTADNAASWTGGEVPAVSETAGFRPAIALRLPRGLTQSQERLFLRLITSATTRQYEVADWHLDSSGWHLICLDQFTNALESGTWRIEATLAESDLHFVSNPGDGAVDNESSIEVGGLFLLPWQRVKRGRTPAVYPLRLGPLAPQIGGGLAAVIDSYALSQWGPDLSETTAAPWTDSLNSEEDIRGVSASNRGSLVGTDSGLVALIKPDGSQELIDGAHTDKSAHDSREGVLATAIADDANVAVAGTLRGQIKFYDLQEQSGSPVSVTDAHSREIVAIAFTRDGRLLASAAADGSLRFWNRHSDRLELLFEMTTQTVPMRKMMFSSDARYLYTLRNNERGIRRIDLSQLSGLFEEYGIPLP